MEASKQNDIFEMGMFDVIQHYINDSNVTDIDWNGDNLWITDITKGRYMSDIKLTDEFILNLCTKLSNEQNQQFNRHNPILESSFANFRISIWHESFAGKTSISIRSNPPYLRFASRESIYQSGYCPERMLNFIENCVQAHLNVVIGGLPEVGKTELLKYLGQFIPDNEKVGVYEDNPEIHFKTLYPTKDSVEICVNDVVDYENVIKAGLRHNIKWTLLSEARRGMEVDALLNTLSSGVHCITTVHTDDVRTIPDRMYNMIGESNASVRVINNVYRYFDVGILVTKDESNQNRETSQICLYSREDGNNICAMVYDYGVTNDEQYIPSEIMKQFKRYNIHNPFERMDH